MPLLLGDRPKSHRRLGPPLGVLSVEPGGIPLEWSEGSYADVLKAGRFEQGGKSAG